MRSRAVGTPGTRGGEWDVVGRAMLLAAIGLMAMAVLAVATGDATSLTGSAWPWSYR